MVGHCPLLHRRLHSIEDYTVAGDAARIVQHGEAIHSPPVIETDLNLVFPNRAGNPLCQSHMLSRHFFPALNKAGVPRVRFHDLRHTYASLLIDQGENIKYIQSQLGHSSPTVTLDVYAHLIKPSNQEAALKLDKTIFSSSGSRMVANKEKGLPERRVTP